MAEMNHAFAFYMLNAAIAVSAFFIFLAGCRPHPPPEPEPSLFEPAGFNSSNALAHARRLAATVPRHSGSPGAILAAEQIRTVLAAEGLKTSIDAFDDDTPMGPVTFRNVIGILPAAGDSNEAPWIVIGAHYDAKSGVADNFQGANDSGSGVGVALELARVVAAARPPPANFMFAFFDGEECRVRYGPGDGLHGSMRLAAQLARDGRARKVLAVIVLDMVGDRDLNVTIPRNGALSLVSVLFRAAAAEGARDKFSLWMREILDDHQPFLSAGMPAIDVIDFEYGSGPGRNDYWHTPQDTVEKISAESMGTVGRTVLRMLDILLREKDLEAKTLL